MDRGDGRGWDVWVFVRLKRVVFVVVVVLVVKGVRDDEDLGDVVCGKGVKRVCEGV